LGEPKPSEGGEAKVEEVAAAQAQPDEASPSAGEDGTDAAEKKEDAPPTADQADRGTKRPLEKEEGTAAKEGEGEKESKQQRRDPKKKIALIVGYLGSNYKGLQKQRGMEDITIEGVMEKALHKCGAVSDDNFGSLGKIRWSRAGRTDKGVHAVAQTLGFKAVLVPNFIDELNKALPNDIRAFGYYRVRKGFDAKNDCSARVYEYIIPSYMLMPYDWEKEPVMERDLRTPEEIISDMKEKTSGKSGNAVYVKEKGGKGKGGDESDGGDDDDEEASVGRFTFPPEEVINRDYEEALKYRIDDESLTLFRSALSKYEKTHNFHNFTIRKNPDDASAMRYIISCKCDSPMLLNGVEYLRCEIIGQSFMLHQIRKLIGLAMGLVRFRPDARVMDVAMLKRKIEIPKAPGDGLMMNRVMYTAYNRKFGGDRESITYQEFESAMDTFKADVIYPHIVAKDAADKMFLRHRYVIDRRPHIYQWAVDTFGHELA